MNTYKYVLLFYLSSTSPEYPASKINVYKLQKNILSILLWENIFTFPNYIF